MANPEPVLSVRPLLAATALGGLPDDGLDALCAVAAVQRYKVATLLWSAGTPMQSLWLVVQGQIDIYDRQTEGTEGLVGMVGAGRCVSWVGLFMTQPHQQDFWAAEDSVLIALPAATVRQVVARHPALYPRLIDEIGNRMQIFMQLVGQAAVGNAEQRLAGLLHGLNAAMNTTAPGLGDIGQIAVTVGDVAKALAFYRDTLGLSFLFSAGPNLAFVQAGSVRLMLSTPQGGGAVGANSVLYFRTADLDASYAAVCERGAHAESAPHCVARMPDHELWMAFVRDPDRNLVGLMQERPT